MTNGAYLSKTDPSAYLYIQQTSDSCWWDCCADGCLPAFTYIKGLSGPYYQCSNSASMGNTENKLVYYKKGQETWGGKTGSIDHPSPE